MVDRMLGNGEAQLREFTALGGQVLFGTDVGYMTDYDPSDEYAYMQRAGLSIRSAPAGCSSSSR